MDRWANGMRAACGLLLLLNIAVFFLSVTVIENQNSPGSSVLTYTQFDYVAAMTDGELPHDDYMKKADYEGSTLTFWVVIAFMVFPLLLSAIGGIYGLAGGPRQLVTGICSLICFGCYGAQFFLLSRLWPGQMPDVCCGRGTGSYLTMIVPGVAALFGILTFILMPRIKRTKDSTIPDVWQIKQEREQAAYHIVEESNGRQQATERQQATGRQPASGGQQAARRAGGMASAEASPAAGPRGVLVGLTGMYAGAEIAFSDGMTIRLGRLPDNDLVFSNETRVSRRHCQLTWYGADKIFKITDFSSSGTYIYGSGVRVPQNVEAPLPPGTVLDIGDGNNRFRLE